MLLRSTLSFLSLIVVLLPAASAARAETGLGITGASLRLGAEADKGTPAFADFTVDVAITAHHGFQGDLGLRDTASGTEGRLGAHLYMTPEPGRKYGLFAFASDFDDRSASYGGLGAEGLLALGDRTALEIRGGLGLSDDTSLDFIFAEAGVHHALTDAFGIGLALTVSDFDEADFRATGHDLRLTLDYSPEGQSWGVFADLSHDALHGRDGRSGDTTLRAGLSLRWGSRNAGGPELRSYSSPDPLRGLIRRGLF